MAELLVISGSPIVGASTDLILQMIAEVIVAVCQPTLIVNVTTVKLNNLNFTPCQSCGLAPPEGYCIYDDDVTPVLEKLARCDCLLFGSPVYFDSVSAQAKMLIDRCNCMHPADFEDRDPKHTFLRRIERKRPGAMVLVGGERGWFEGARRVIAGFFKWIEVVNEGMVIYHSPDFKQSGTVAGNRETQAEAARLGRHLAQILLRGDNA